MKLFFSTKQKLFLGLMFWLLQWVLLLLLQKYPIYWSVFYQNKLYPSIHNVLLTVYSYLPFSVGDLIYLGCIILLFVHLLKLIQTKGRLFLQKVSFWVWLLGFAHLYFHISWGLHYLRDTEIDFSSNTKASYSAQELYNFSMELHRRADILHQRLHTDSETLPFVPAKSPKQMYYDAYQTWNTLSKNSTTAFRPINHTSIKTSIFSTPLSYMGYSGYFNPFTHEAQVNINIPKYNMPTTILHEMSHQIGVADEGEANWFGFRASILSNHEYIQYSGYTYALKYCFRNLYQLDEDLALQLKENISTGIWANFMETEQYFEKYASPLEFVSKHFYDLFLKYNRQTDGIQGYNRLVDMLLEHPLPNFE